MLRNVFRTVSRGVSIQTVFPCALTGGYRIFRPSLGKPFFGPRWILTAYRWLRVVTSRAWCLHRVGFFHLEAGLMVAALNLDEVGILPEIGELRGLVAAVVASSDTSATIRERGVHLILFARRR